MLTCTLTLSQRYESASCVGTVLRESYKYAIRTKLKSKQDLPTKICGRRVRGLMDSILIHYMPTFEEEVYDFYLGVGGQMTDLYTEEEIKHIDNFLLELLQTRG